ncbi:MAG: DUF6265 family protein [Bryobacteraceae bacterium]
MRKMLLLLLAPIAWAESDVQSLGWFAGCWEMRNPAGTFSIEEMWTKPAGESLLGMGRTIRNGKTLFTEFQRIAVENGKLTYFARIGTKGATSFPLVKMTDSEVVFENPTHDFPQRVIYRKVQGGLFARIEGVDKGKEKHEEFPYKRVSCE